MLKINILIQTNKTQDTNFSVKIKNSNPLPIEITDSKIAQKLDRF